MQLVASITSSTLCGSVLICLHAQGRDAWPALGAVELSLCARRLQPGMRCAVVKHVSALPFFANSVGLPRVQGIIGTMAFKLRGCASCKGPKFQSFSA